MTKLSGLIRSDLETLEAYVPVDVSTGRIFLQANESPWDYRQHKDDSALNRYPACQPQALVQQLAQHYQVGDDQVLLSCGSDQAIDLLIRLVCNPKTDAIVVCPPTFSMYAFYAKLQCAEVIEVPLMEEPADFSWDCERLAAIKNPQVKLIFICSPNNPTGSVIPSSQLFALCEHYATQALVVVDEAYIEFAATSSVAHALTRYPNLVVLRTLSKAHGLAGARFGVTLANAWLIEGLKKIIPPYPLPSLTLDAVARALQKERMAEVAHQIAQVKQEREKLLAHFRQSPLIDCAWHSEANFIFFRAKDPVAFLAACTAQGIMVRYFAKCGTLTNCFRLSIGTPLENEAVLHLL